MRSTSSGIDTALLDPCEPADQRGLPRMPDVAGPSGPCDKGSRVYVPAFAGLPGDHLQAQRSGCIVHVGSVAGLTAFTRSPLLYSAAKAGVHSLTRVLAAELGEHGVTANALAPGTTATGRVVAVRGQVQRDEIGKSMVLGRIGEVADTVG